MPFDGKLRKANRCVKRVCCPQVGKVSFVRIPVSVRNLHSLRLWKGSAFSVSPKPALHGAVCNISMLFPVLNNRGCDYGRNCKATMGSR